jgi:hypothetical protein
MRNDHAPAPDLLRSAYGLAPEIRPIAASSLTSTPPAFMQTRDNGVSREIVGREKRYHIAGRDVRTLASSGRVN